MVKKMRKYLWIVSTYLLTACTSQYHVGANIHDDGYALFRPVAKHVKEDIRSFEEQCVKAFIKCDIDKIVSLSTPELSKQIKESGFSAKLTEIKNKYGFGTVYSIRKLHNTSYYMDEIIDADQYRVYEVFICEYDIEGTIDSHIRLVITGRPSQFKLWGFEIHKAEIGEKIPDIRLATKEVKGWWTFGVPPH